MVFTRPRRRVAYEVRIKGRGGPRGLSVRPGHRGGPKTYLKEAGCPTKSSNTARPTPPAAVNAALMKSSTNGNVLPFPYTADAAADWLAPEEGSAGGLRGGPLKSKSTQGESRRVRHHLNLMCFSA